MMAEVDELGDFGWKMIEKLIKIGEGTGVQVAAR
jgi:hypothetical protein